VPQQQIARLFPPRLSQFGGTAPTLRRASFANGRLLTPFPPFNSAAICEFFAIFATMLST